MSNPIFVKTPQPDTEERLVLVPPGTCTDYVDKPGLVRLVTTDARDATPDDLARGGYVPVERAEKAEWSARVARMALANEHQDREGVRIRKDLGTQDAPCPCDTDPEQGMGMNSPPCPLHEAVRELRRKTSWKDAALTLDGELKNALVRAEKAEGLLIQRETELRLAREDGAAVERQMREARSAADASFVRANQAEKRAEKAERERDEEKRHAGDAADALARLMRERDAIRAEVARLTAPGEGSEGEPTDWLGMWNGFTLGQVEDSLYGRIKRVWRAGVAHERARQQPTKDVERAEKDRATDEELEELYATAYARAHGRADEETLDKGEYAGLWAVVAHVRQERCLVAQAVGMGADLYVTAHGVAYRVTVAKGRHMQRAYPDAVDVPSTLARLLGEVGRG